MPSRINRPPVGLQDLLGSQSFGDNPNELLQFVTPTLDLEQFYESDLIDATALAVQIPGTLAATNIDIDQPEGSLWIPYAENLTLNGAVDPGVKFGVTFQLVNAAFPTFPAGIVTTHARGQHFAASVIGEVMGYGFLFPRPIPRRGPCTWRAVVQYDQGAGAGNDEFIHSLIFLSLNV